MEQIIDSAMPNFTATKTHIIYAAGIITVIALLICGVKILNNHSGSSGMKKAVQDNKRCQQLMLQGGKPYTDCQKELDDLLSKLVAENDLDVKDQCKVNPDDKKSALCTVTVWYASEHIVTTEPGIVQKVNESSTQSITRGLRRKRVANSLPPGQDLSVPMDTHVRRRRELYKVVGESKVNEGKIDSDSTSSSESDKHHRKRAGHQDVQEKTDNTATYIQRGGQR